MTEQTDHLDYVTRAWNLIVEWFQFGARWAYSDLANKSTQVRSLRR